MFHMLDTGLMLGFACFVVVFFLIFAFMMSPVFISLLRQKNVCVSASECLCVVFFLP